MTAPTVSVTVHLEANGAPLVGVTVAARLDKSDEYQGFEVSDPVYGVTDVNGDAVLQQFPNNPTTGLGTTGSRWNYSARPAGASPWTATAQIPNQDCRLEDVRDLPYVPGITAAQAAQAAAQAYAVTAGASAATAAADAAAVATDRAAVEAALATSPSAAALGANLALSTGAALVATNHDGTPTVQDLLRVQDKSPVVGWAGLNLLWLGTSIPAQGNGVDSYPELFCAALGCTVTNLAWPGSHVLYNINGASNTDFTVKALSMTEDDRLAGLALYGSSSAYSDTFGPVTKASHMTCDYRIKAPFLATPFDVVVLDHAHNDRTDTAGTLSPTTVSIVAITKGATTTVQTSAPLGVVVGNGVALEIDGIPSLDNFAGRVMSVSGNQFTFNLDSSGYTGALVSGSAIKLDRNTFYGSFEFVLHYIRWAAYQGGVTDPTIILAGAPTEYETDASYDATIRLAAGYLRAIAAKWGLAFFDIATAYGVTSASHLARFPDGTHPTTRITRQPIANHWVAWALGGMTKKAEVGEYLPGTVDQTYTDQREAMYSRFLRGYGAPQFILGDPVSVISEDFATGGAGWTFLGTHPTVAAAPWNAAEYALHCVSSVVQDQSYIRRDLACDAGVVAQFDLWLPQVSGLTASTTSTIVELMRLGTAAGSDVHYSLQLLVSDTDVKVRVSYFEGTGNTGHVVLDESETTLQANFKHTLRFEAVRGAAGYDGMLLMYLDDELVSPFALLSDSSQPAVGRVYFGVISSTTAAALDVYVGNLTLTKRAASDYSTRFTGQAQGIGQTTSFVNGVAVSQTGSSSSSTIPSYTWAALYALSLTGTMTDGDEFFCTDVPAGGRRSHWYWDATASLLRVFSPTLIALNTAVIDGAQQTAAQYLAGLTLPAGLLKGATFEHVVGFGKTGTTDAYGTATFRMGTGVVTDAVMGTINLATQLAAANRSYGIKNLYRMTTATNLQKLGSGTTAGSFVGTGVAGAPNADVTVLDVTTNAPVIGASTTMGGAVADKPQVTYQAIILQP